MYKEQDSTALELTEFNEGDYFGETALIKKDKVVSESCLIITSPLMGDSSFYSILLILTALGRKK